MERLQLQAQKRTISGRKVKQIRKQGFLPANVYGKKITSKAVQVAVKDFTSVFAKAGGSGLVELSLADKKVPVLIHNVQYHPVTNTPLHAVHGYESQLQGKENDQNFVINASGDYFSPYVSGWVTGYDENT